MPTKNSDCYKDGKPNTTIRIPNGMWKKKERKGNAWNKTQNQNELKSRRLGCSVGTNWRERWRRVKPFVPLIVVGSLGNWIEKFGPLITTRWEYQEGDIIFFHRDMGAGAALAPLCSALGLCGWGKDFRQRDIELLSIERVHPCYLPVLRLAPYARLLRSYKNTPNPLMVTS